MRIRVFFMIAAGVCLGTIQAPLHVQLALACQQSMLKVQNKLRLTTQHVYGKPGICEMNVLIMPPHLEHALVVATTLGYFLEKCVTLELKEPPYLRMGDSALFFTGFSFVRTHASHRFLVIFQSFFCRSDLDSVCLLASITERTTSRVFTGSCSDDFFAHKMWNLLVEL